MRKWLLIIGGSLLILAGCGQGDNEALPYEDENNGADIAEENTENAEDNGANNDEEVADNSGENEGLTAADDGEELYEQACASCHGGELEGGMGPDIADASYEETMEYLVEDPDDTHEGLLSEEESEALAEWIEDY